MPAPLRVVETVNPADFIYEQCGEFLDGIEPVGTGVLVVLYDRSMQKGELRSEGGIILPDAVPNSSVNEDKYQGKAGLVIALGAAAFLEDAKHIWKDRLPKVGDWVLMRHSDIFLFDLPVKDDKTNKHRRAGIVEDVNIQAILRKPQVIY